MQFRTPLDISSTLHSAILNAPMEHLRPAPAPIAATPTLLPSVWDDPDAIQLHIADVPTDPVIVAPAEKTSDYVHAVQNNTCPPVDEIRHAQTAFGTDAEGAERTALYQRIQAFYDAPFLIDSFSIQEMSQAELLALVWLSETYPKQTLSRLFRDPLLGRRMHGAPFIRIFLTLTAVARQDIQVRKCLDLIMRKFVCETEEYYPAPDIIALYFSVKRRGSRSDDFEFESCPPSVIPTRAETGSLNKAWAPSRWISFDAFDKTSQTGIEIKTFHLQYWDDLFLNMDEEFINKYANQTRKYDAWLSENPDRQLEIVCLGRLRPEYIEALTSSLSDNNKSRVRLVHYMPCDFDAPVYSTTLKDLTAAEICIQDAAATESILADASDASYLQAVIEALSALRVKVGKNITERIFDRNDIAADLEQLSRILDVIGSATVRSHIVPHLSRVAKVWQEIPTDIDIELSTTLNGLLFQALHHLRSYLVEPDYRSFNFAVEKIQTFLFEARSFSDYTKPVSLVPGWEKISESLPPANSSPEQEAAELAQRLGPHFVAAAPFLTPHDHHQIRALLHAAPELEPLLNEPEMWEDLFGVPLFRMLPVIASQLSKGPWREKGLTVFMRSLQNPHKNIYATVIRLYAAALAMEKIPGRAFLYYRSDKFPFRSRQQSIKQPHVAVIRADNFDLYLPDEEVGILYSLNAVHSDRPPLEFSPIPYDAKTKTAIFRDWLLENPQRRFEMRVIGHIHSAQMTFWKKTFGALAERMSVTQVFPWRPTESAVTLRLSEWNEENGMARYERERIRLHQAPQWQTSAVRMQEILTVFKDIDAKNPTQAFSANPETHAQLTRLQAELGELIKIDSSLPLNVVPILDGWQRLAISTLPADIATNAIRRLLNWLVNLEAYLNDASYARAHALARSGQSLLQNLRHHLPDFDS